MENLLLVFASRSLITYFAIIGFSFWSLFSLVFVFP